MAISEWHKDVADNTVYALQKLGYSGYGSIEYKLDPRDDGLKMTEITCRTWYPHALSERCGLNIPYIAYCDLLGLESEPVPKTYLQGAKWIDEEGDFRSAFIYWREGELSIKDWIKSYRGKKFYATFTWDDLKPGLVFIFYHGRRLIEAIFKGIFRPVKRLVIPNKS
jgi:predicted ATP-grasp superfamily ATP-dependent carboligase